MVHPIVRDAFQYSHISSVCTNIEVRIIAQFPGLFRVTKPKRDSLLVVQPDLGRLTAKPFKRLQEPTVVLVT
jgi:hypothetical protein